MRFSRANDDKPDSKKIATVSLSDCLACSGCVTTAETILIAEQSFHRLLSRLAAQDSTVVVSISPQSYTSIALHLKTDPSTAFLRLATFLKEALGVHYVFDTSSAGDVSLVASAQEFIAR